MTFGDLCKTLIEDWVRYRWKDTAALGLIAGGFWVLLHTQNTMALDSAKGIIGAGLIILDPRGMMPGTSGNGKNGSNGKPATSAPTSANPDAPPTVPSPAGIVAAELQTSAKLPEGWPRKP
jgi:hypothetical protein